MWNRPKLLTYLRRVICIGFMGTLYAATTTLLVAGEESDRPNVVVILADDMGYSDLGCYGSEIATPNLDRLAAGGLKFTQFYNTARCWPTRAAFLTGYYAQQVHRDGLPGLGGGVNGIRQKWARLLPDFLKPYGYRCYHSGKWHIDGKVLDAGFDRSLRMNNQGNFFTNDGNLIDDVPVTPVADESGYYATIATADHAIDCLREHTQQFAGRPFFQYIAFTAPHFPLHALPEDIARYQDNYLEGWEAMREHRFAHQQEMGLLETTLSVLEPDVGPPYHFPGALERLGPGEINRPLPWDDLTEQQRQFQATKMAIHAAMVDRMDREIGRVIDQLKAMGAYENTLIVFVSDNGASAEIMVRDGGHDPQAPPGSETTYLCLGPGFSSAANTPFRRHKTWVHEGGISTPLIVHWPAGFQAYAELRHTPAHMIDIVPTILQVAGIEKPAAWDGETIPPAPGHSLVPAFASDVVIQRDCLWWLHEGNRAIRIGDWKLAAAKGDPWELYDLRTDRAESRDLAQKLPEKRSQLEVKWNQQLKEISRLASASSPSAEDVPRSAKPNIIVILADDLGYADLGCQGSQEVMSPQIDSIATNGVRFTSGYVSAPQCCPSRAGLLPGRYQNRFGFEANWPASMSGKVGLPASERTIADHLKTVGYVTGMIGKWHLGESEPMRPYNRGFDETFWHANGGVLFPEKKTGFLSNVFRGPDPVQVAEYSTDAFGREAVEFIERHQRNPFFLYLAFVPPHWPMEAKPEHMEQYAHIPDMHRRTMLAMMASLDENVGRVLTKVRESGLDENTLIFFLSDNGGPTGSPRTSPNAPFEYGQNASRNDPCRGVKGDLLEGGIRVPFLVQWKGHIPASQILDHPVVSLDILPTALAAASVNPTQSVQATLDGANLLPYLTGENQGPPHDTLFWRFRFPPAYPALHRWAIRQGDWKLVKNGSEPLSLYQLANDIGETNNLATEHPGRVRAMHAAWKQWDASNKEPIWKEPKRVMLSSRQAKAEVLATEIHIECTGNDPQILFSDIPAAIGPFTLELKLKSTSHGPGQVFWSTASSPEFTAAQQIAFSLKHDSQQWHEYTLELPAVTPSLTHLRLDPGEAPGVVRIARIVLKDASGKVVKSWMEQARTATKPPTASP